MKKPVAIVIGGGSTGSACAHDLALRGFKVILVERGEIGSGTTGRSHCLVHSGGRYCLKDQEAAIECIDENMILRKIMPNTLELNGGLFVAVDDGDMAMREKFVAGCEACHIPYQELNPKEALQVEPNLNPNLKWAVRVPDGVFESLRFCLSFLATAKKNGADIHTYTQVLDLLTDGRGNVTGVKVWNRAADKRYDIEADIVVNATGAWVGEITSLVGAEVPIQPTPGVMVSMFDRVVNLVLNRLNLPSDGDIIVPQRQTSIIGTSSWTVKNADYIPVPEDHVKMMFERGGQLAPNVLKAKVRGVFAVARPLIASAQLGDGRELSRTFEAFDHAKRDGIDGLVTITGGKVTTARAMAEKTVDVVCRKLAIDAPCRTRDSVLCNYREYYA